MINELLSDWNNSTLNHTNIFSVCDITFNIKISVKEIWECLVNAVLQIKVYDLLPFCYVQEKIWVNVGESLLNFNFSDISVNYNNQISVKYKWIFTNISSLIKTFFVNK